MGGDTEILVRIELVSLANQEARKSFEELGIIFKPASFEDVYRIASRDTKGRVYSYLAGFSEYGKIIKRWIFSKDGIEIGFYCTGLSVKKETGEKVGEVGMVHVAPALRRKGLGTLISLLGRMELVEGGAEIFKSVVGDETGTILRLNEQLGFVDTGEKAGLFSHPVQQLLITNREKSLQTLKDLFSQKIKKIRTPNLNFKPEEVDIDNPQRVSSVTEVVSQRITDEDYSPKETRVLFGYHYAPIFLSQESSENSSTCLHLVVRENTANDITLFKNRVKEAFPDFFLEVLRLPSRPEFFEIWSPELRVGEEIKRFALTFAQIGESFFEQCRKEQKAQLLLRKNKGGFNYFVKDQ